MSQGRSPTSPIGSEQPPWDQQPQLSRRVPQRSNTGQSDGASSFHSHNLHQDSSMNRRMSSLNITHPSQPVNNATISPTRSSAGPSSFSISGTTAPDTHQIDPSIIPHRSSSWIPSGFSNESAAASSTPRSPVSPPVPRGNLAPSTSYSDDLADYQPTRNRADMDRIKSRAVDPGWSWESERDKYEASAAAAAASLPKVGLPPPKSLARPTAPRIDTGPSNPNPTSTMASAQQLLRRGSNSNDPSPQSVHFPTHSTSSSQVSIVPADASSSSQAVEQTISNPPPTVQPQSVTQSSSRPRKEQNCRACGKVMTGQFVRALGSVYHLDCFRCNDCGKVVAAKFFPATDDMVDSSGAGSLFPLCETDYFRRLDLICAKCGGALRGSYITALGIKFHVEHFTCSVCPTVFGPQDSYYEHDGQVFCHFHYSTRFAIKCTGCKTAILKQFVEINRNNADEHWHPECYMIHKFWNIKLYPAGSTPKEGAAAMLIDSEQAGRASMDQEASEGAITLTTPTSNVKPTSEALEIEATETPSSLKQKQKQMEERVYRIWTVLSAFEESSAACISEMLRHVSSGRYLGGVRMAEKFIFHVEILFSAIDDLEAHFRIQQAKGISHIREARMLCKKIVNFFSLLSHTQETGARRMGITQELLSLVTGLAHYLKILIRIALTGALKLDRDYHNPEALSWFLNQLAFSAKQGGNSNDNNQGASSQMDTHAMGPDGKWYGYKSLPRSTNSGSADNGETATDLCVACGQTVEEECLRMGVNLRWHSNCLKCHKCSRQAIREGVSSKRLPDPDPNAPEPLSAPQFGLETVRRPYDPAVPNGAPRFAQAVLPLIHMCLCPDCMVQAKVRIGFESVTRLEQYAFLLRVALNRLFALLKKRGVVPASPPTASANLQDGMTEASLVDDDDNDQVSMHEAYRDSQDIKRMKSVNLDRKLSTKAKVPRISTVVGGPSGRQTQTSDVHRASPTEINDPRRSPRQASPSFSPHESHSPTGPRSASTSREPSPSGRHQQQAGPTGLGLQQQQQQQPQPQQLQQQQAYQQQQQQHQQQMRERGRAPFPPPNVPFRSSQQRGLSPSLPEPGSIVPIRPAFARHNTDIQIREDGPIRQPSGDDARKGAPSEDGITLADIPHILEVEQAREQHKHLHEGARAISELSALELFIVKHVAVMMLQQSALKDMVNLDDLIEFIETRKNTFWGKIFKGGKDKKEIKKKGVFGIPLEILVERNGADSTLGASAAHLRVPSFIDDIISAMKQMDLSVEGIFRKNGNIRRLKELSEALDRDSSLVNLLDDNPVQLAALLKKFLRELPDPLMTFKLHKLFVTSQKLEPESERRRILRMVTILLPKGHRDTMEVLFAFLKWVASFSHIDEETGSKMDLNNLATVICPNILYSKGNDPAKDETFLANRAVSYLLEHQDDFWLVPEELEAVLQDRELINSSVDLTSRDILKKCEKYAKRPRPAGGPLGSRPPMGGPLHSGEIPNRHRPDLHPPTTMRQAHQHQQQMQLQMQLQHQQQQQQQQYQQQQQQQLQPQQPREGQQQALPSSSGFPPFPPQPPRPDGGYPYATPANGNQIYSRSPDTTGWLGTHPNGGGNPGSGVGPADRLPISSNHVTPQKNFNPYNGYGQPPRTPVQANGSGLPP